MLSRWGSAATCDVTIAPPVYRVKRTARPCALIVAHTSQRVLRRGSGEERDRDQRGGVTIDEADWAISEFGPALLGDQRRTNRLIALATVLAQRPEVSLPVACDDLAMRKGACLFFENKASEPAEILASYGKATWERVPAVPVVLAVQDTTELDVSLCSDPYPHLRRLGGGEKTWYRRVRSTRRWRPRQRTAEPGGPSWRRPI